MLETRHRFIFGDARKLEGLENESIDLVVTSPPYPMIEMWDTAFAQMNPDIGGFLQKGDYSKAFASMHAVLDEVWQDLYRVMKNGAMACINIGDATRTIEGRFQLFANHSRIQSKCFELGFDVLPLILWRKQTNAPTKFMGSGMLPAGAYVTLEHEYILIFRKGKKRIFASAQEKQNRRESSFFWEERNSWFSDFWDFKGTRQDLNARELRGRSAAFPFSLPFRLINMFSVFGDTVLDPFLGTGTTILAAMAAGRNSVGYEIDKSFAPSIGARIKAELGVLGDYNLRRLKKHAAFVEEYKKEKGPLKYTNNNFGFPVMTNQERDLMLVFVRSVEKTKDDVFQVSYFGPENIKNLLIRDLSLEDLQAGGAIQQSLIVADKPPAVT